MLCHEPPQFIETKRRDFEIIVEEDDDVSLGVGDAKIPLPGWAIVEEEHSDGVIDIRGIRRDDEDINLNALALSHAP